MNIPHFILSNRAYFEDFVTRATYHSNAIEGSTLSYAETYAILFNDNTLKINATARELYEAINHKYALNYVLSHLDHELSETMIKHLARQINHNIQEISGYRTQSVLIRGAAHLPPSPKEVPNLMLYYVHNYNNTVYSNIYEKIADQHIRFEQIHPFSDGNGRTGRLLMNFELLRHNLPPIVIDKEQRTEYFKYLADSNVMGLAQFIQQATQREHERIQHFVSLTQERTQSRSIEPELEL
ncbi:MAG: Fic family protein [Aerococcaceae bacterium]|nr:Fic family protein [Aerococcaceae bacterium]